MNSTKYEDLFVKIYVALCSNPAIVTMAKVDSGIINSSTPTYEGYITPQILDITGKLTALYYTLDFVEIERDIDKTLGEFRADQEKIENLMKNLPNMNGNN